MEATVLAHRIAITTLIDALPVRDKIAAHNRLLELISTRNALPGVVPGTTYATDVRWELDAIVADLRRSALTSLPKTDG
jgi:hypothetical protein